MEQETIDHVNAAPKRPAFLTVLCILTFVGSGLGIFNGITTAFMSKTAGKVMDASKKIDSMHMSMQVDSTSSPEEKVGAEMATKMMGNMLEGVNETTIKNSGYASIIASIITLLGALMMWRLRKSGFWIYVVGVIISIAAPIAIYGGGNIMGALSAIGMGFIGILFIILYAVNKKHLIY